MNNEILNQFISEIKSSYSEVVIEYINDVTFFSLNGRKVLKAAYKNDELVAYATDGSGRETFVKSVADLAQEFENGRKIAMGEVCTLRF